MKQYELFSSQEADNWFIRNKETIINRTSENDICTQFIKNNLPQEEISSILELGASNGYRLNFLKTFFPNCSRFVGTDLSQQAVEDGRKRYGLTMYQAPIEELINEEPFDLVILSGVLCWVDRENLFKVIYNIDKLVKNDKYLCIADFDPFFPQKNTYHHTSCEDIYTFKQDFSQIFLASNIYSILQKLYYVSGKNNYTLSEKNKQILTQYNRRSISILHKNTLAYYL